MEQDGSKEIRGIGGWLLLFILTRTVIGPPWNAFRLFQQWEQLRDIAPEYASGSEFATLHILSWSVFGISTAIQFAVGIMMWRRLKPSSVVMAIASLWFCAVVLAIGGHFFALFLVDAEFEIADLKSFIFPILSAAVWTAYLSRSIRVKNTYIMKS